MSGRTSIVPHPANSFFIKTYKWQIDAIRELAEEDLPNVEVRCAAELLGLFEYHTMNPLANARLYEYFQQATLLKYQFEELMRGWLPYSYRKLETYLNNTFSMKIIVRAVPLLEKIGFIYPQPNDFDALAFGGKLQIRTNQTWIKLHVGNMRRYVKEKYPDYYVDDVNSVEADGHVAMLNTVSKTETNAEITRLVQEGELAEMTAPETENETLPEIIPEKRLTPSEIKARDITMIAKYHRHVFRKAAIYVYDARRTGRVSARLQEGRSVGQIAQAVIGCAVSEWHQGANDRNKAFNDIELICRNAQKFESFLESAYEKEISEDDAKSDLQRVLDGGESLYRVEERKTARGRAMSEREPKPDPELNGDGDDEKAKLKVALEIPADYRSFANSVAAYLFHNRPVEQVLEIAESGEVVNLGRGLTNAEKLEDALKFKMKIWGDLNADKQAAIKDFAARYTARRLEDK